MQKQKIYPLIFVCLVLLFTMLACISGGGGGGTEAKKCVSVNVDNIKSAPGGGVDVQGTLTNNCSQDISYAKIETTCYSSSGDVLDRDPEYVENVTSGDKTYYESPMDTGSAQVDRCASEVTEAGY